MSVRRAGGVSAAELDQSVLDLPDRLGRPPEVVLGVGAEALVVPAPVVLPVTVEHPAQVTAAVLQLDLQPSSSGAGSRIGRRSNLRCRRASITPSSSPPAADQKRSTRRLRWFHAGYTAGR